MFICIPCRNYNQLPERLAKSRGRCEVCGQWGVCDDFPSHQIPSGQALKDPWQDDLRFRDDLELMKMSMRWLEDIEDEGPTGEGWRSDRLKALIDEITQRTRHVNNI